MIFHKFKIRSTPHIHEAYCECGNSLEEVSNGWLSTALYCTKCENVYLLKLVKYPKKKVSNEFLDQCRFEIKFKEEKIKLRNKLEDQIKNKNGKKGKV